MTSISKPPSGFAHDAAPVTPTSASPAGPALGSLTTVDVRTIWPHEAQHFTPWLARNLDRLGAALGIDLELQGTEAECGDFSLDLLAHDVTNDRVVVIENQLEETDHDHLGKLMTYAAGYEAGSVIWIAPRFREEHRQAIDWLNQRTDPETNFFGVLVEVLRIDDSKPAVDFRIVAMPNAWQKDIARAKASTQPTAREEALRAFFQALIDELRDVHHFTNAKKAQPQGFYQFASGTSRVTYIATFGKNQRLRAELYLDFPEQAKNKAIFDALYAEAAKYDARMGEKLSWERLEDNRSSKVAVYRPGSIDDDEESLAQAKAWFIDRLLRLKSTFQNAVEALV